MIFLRPGMAIGIVPSCEMVTMELVIVDKIDRVSIIKEPKPQASVADLMEQLAPRQQC